MENNKINLLGATRSELKTLVTSLGFKSYSGDQLFKWIHNLGVTDFAMMSNLSKNLREILLEKYQVLPSQVSHEHYSKDETIKWLVKIHNGSLIETVFIPKNKRNTLCISSQAGCTLNCSFCYTAKQGFSTNLFSSEIIGQLWLAKFKFNKKITNVVMMGMGEPLLNFNEVIKSLDIMRDNLGYDLSRRKVTVSTSGMVPEIYKLSEVSDVSLAISLHAPNDELRNVLVPLNKKYPIKDLLAACKYFLSSQKHAHPRITIEYIMLKNVNDSIAHAKELSKLLQQIPCKINLIPFNPFEGANYQVSSLDIIQKFSNILIRAGFVVTIRVTRGQDIQAACGQLAGQIKDRTKRNLRYNKSINNQKSVFI